MPNPKCCRTLAVLREVNERLIWDWKETLHEEKKASARSTFQSLDIIKTKERQHREVLCLDSDSETVGVV